MILIACHKKCDVPNDSLYLPIQVGSFNREDIGFMRDDQGENISELNNKYCELTALYYAYKNLDYDYLGLVQYRRYLTIKKTNNIDEVLNKKECEDLLKKYKIILPKKRKYYVDTIYNHYSNTFHKEHLDISREVIKELNPEYLSYFDKFMNERSAYIWNMFVMNKELINEYCDFLFPLLKEIDNRIDDGDYSDFHKRYIGRISERLFNVWLKYKLGNHEISEADIIEINYTDLGNTNWFKKISSFLMAKFLKKKYEESF